MPYIPTPDRERAEFEPTSGGELNYAITKLCLDYIDSHEQLSYALLSEVIASLECAKQEMYRRLVGPYEDVKALDNGDVY